MTRLGGSFDWDRVAFTMSDVSYTNMQSRLLILVTVFEQSGSGNILPYA